MPFQNLRFLCALCLLIMHIPSHSQCLTFEGGAIINEFSNGPFGNKEFVELLITGVADQNVDISGFILDDNNHPQKGVGNEPGHVVLGSCFSDLTPGTLIVIYNDQDLHPKITADIPDGSIFIPFSDPCIIKMEGCPNHDNPNYDCAKQVYHHSTNWVKYIPAHNYGDKIRLLRSNAEVVHEFEWGLPNPSVQTSTQQMCYQHSKNLEYDWQPDMFSSPGRPNNIDNFYLVKSFENLVNYDPLSLKISNSCSELSVEIAGGFPNFTYKIYNVAEAGAMSETLVYEGITDQRLLIFRNFDCGKYKIIVEDSNGCKEIQEVSAKSVANFLIDLTSVGTSFEVGDECSSCANEQCWNWITADINGESFSFSDPNLQIQTLTKQLALQLAENVVPLVLTTSNVPGSPRRKECYFWFNSIPTSIECQSYEDWCDQIVDTDGDGICDEDDHCLGTYGSDDSDGDGICDINDCDPQDPDIFLDTDGDGVCDGIDCNPNDFNLKRDYDGDGYCDEEDCDPFNAGIYLGATCNDGDDCTGNDALDSNCFCIGELIADCAGCQDGAPCDDNDPCTRNDQIDENCECKGEPVFGCVVCIPEQICDDGNACTQNDIFDANCQCHGELIPDCQDCTEGSTCDDGLECTTGDIFDAQCNCLGSYTYVPNLRLLPDNGCDNYGLMLKVNDGFESIKWYKDGEKLKKTESSITNIPSGTYTVKIYTVDNCKLEESLTISESDFLNDIQIELSAPSICNDEEVILSIPSDYKNILWSPNVQGGNNTSPQFSIFSTGDYFVSGTDRNGCPRTGTITIESSIVNAKIDPEHPILCSQDGIELTVPNLNPTGDHYISWFYNDILIYQGVSSIIAYQPGKYSIEYSDGLCIAHHEVEVIMEESNNLHQILLDNGFSFERIQQVGPATVTGAGSSASRSGNCNLINLIESDRKIIALETDPNLKLNLLEYIDSQIEHHCCNQNITAHAQDGFCSDIVDQMNLDDFLINSDKDAIVSYYYKPTTDGSITYLYQKVSNNSKVAAWPKPNEELFRTVLEEILCSKENNENLKLTHEVYTRSIASGPIWLQDLSNHKYDNAKFPFSRTGIYIKNYVTNGVLDFSDPTAILDNPVTTLEYLDLGKRWIKKDEYYEISIPYVAGSLPDEICHEYLEIIMHPSDFGNGTKFDLLFNGGPEYVEEFINVYDNLTYPYNNFEKKILQYDLNDILACYIDMDALCVLLQSTPTKFGPRNYEIAGSILSKIDYGNSPGVIECFSELDGKIIFDFYNTNPNYEYRNVRQDRVKFFKHLLQHYHVVSEIGAPLPELESSPEFPNLVGRKYGDIGKSYEITLSETSVTIQQAFFYKNLPVFYTGQPYEMNYFDRVLGEDSPTFQKYHMFLHDKYYNFLAPLNEGKRQGLFTVPGIYPLYAVEYAKLGDADDDLRLLVDVGLLGVGFGGLTLTAKLSRMQKLYNLLALGDVTISAASLYLNVFEHCGGTGSQGEAFCAEMNSFLEYCQYVLLAGVVTSGLINRLKPVQRKWNDLPMQKQNAILDHMNPEDRAEFVRVINIATDVIQSLKSRYPKIKAQADNLSDFQFFENLVYVTNPNNVHLITANIEATVKALGVDDEGIELGYLFFKDIQNTADDALRIGGNLPAISDKTVKAWKSLLPDELLRKNTDKLTKVDNYANDFGKSFDEIGDEFANIPASQRSGWVDHLEFRTKGKQVNKAGANDNTVFNSFQNNSDVPAKYTDDARFNDLSTDHGQGGSTVQDAYTRREAMAGMEAESQGLIDGPIQRDQSGDFEFIDSNGEYWDVKGPPSIGMNTPAKVTAAANSIKSQLLAPSLKGIILDCSWMTTSELSSLRAALSPSDLQKIIEINSNIF